VNLSVRRFFDLIPTLFYRLIGISSSFLIPFIEHINVLPSEGLELLSGDMESLSEALELSSEHTVSLTKASELLSEALE